jgi:hypothetical protein
MLKTPGLCSYHTDRQVSCLVCSGSVGTADPGTDPNRVPAARRHASEQRIRRQRRYRSMVFTWRVAVLAGPTVNARSAFFPAIIGPTSSAEQRQASAPQAGQGAPRWPAEGGGGVGPGVARGGPRVGTRTRTSGGSRADRAPSVETMNGSTYSGRVQGRRTRRNLSVTLTLFYPHSR